MFAHNWLMWPPLALKLWQLLTCALLLTTTTLPTSSHGQSENAIGAHRVYEKTSFSCAGRPAGYYADVETGCQVYHMCDGLGRQFSYSCPNTTLFQQRMLICDHWYMVNCSKAESHYAANLLIGQRDKPFVGEEEGNLRTPRPDLLDRPYAPDYSGESYRNQYKQLPALPNQIQDSNQKQDKSAPPNQNVPGPQRWKIPAPSRTIQPPAFQTDESATKTTTPLNVRFVPTTTTVKPRTSHRQYNTAGQTASTATRRPTTTGTTRRQQPSGFSNAPLLQRQHEHDDLGTSHSTRYNTSADFNSAEGVNDKTYSNPNGRKTFTANAGASSATAFSASPAKGPLKVPSKIYEPPFLYPIYNQDDLAPTASSTSTTTAPVRVSSAAPFSAPATVRSTAFTTTSTTHQPLHRPTTLAGKPFTASNFGPTVAAPVAAPINAFASNGGRNQNNIRFDATKTSKDARTPTPAQGFKPPTPRPPTNSAKTLRPPKTAQRVEASALDYEVPKNRFNLPTSFNSAATGTGTGPGRSDEAPAKELLPPFADFVPHDVATTQGPPIYYEWKVPSNGLEPPKLEPPFGVDGREYPDSVIDYNTISSNGGFTPSTSFSIDQGGRPTAKNKENPFLPSTRQQLRHDDVATTRTPTSRSIKETGQPNALNRTTHRPRKNTPTTPSTTATSRGGRTAAPTKTPAGPADIQHLREELSVPDFSFPLETIGRTGYLAADTYNSFQLKIPDKRSDKPEDHQHWFGENPQCPECHPSYVVPGTCEPCLRR